MADDSILTSTKKACSIVEDYTVFDDQLILHINSVFSTLNQLGIGPDDGFSIEDASATWASFLGSNKKFNLVKSYMYLRVRMLFDPPTTGYILDSFKQQILELEVRMSILRETNEWVDGATTDVGTIVPVRLGLPLHKRLVVTNGQNIWADLSLFEAKLLVRAEQDPRSQVIADLSSFVTCSLDDSNNIVVDWQMNGQQTLTVVDGYFDLVLSDVGDANVQAIKIFYGYLRGGS